MKSKGYKGGSKMKSKGYKAGGKMKSKGYAAGGKMKSKGYKIGDVRQTSWCRRCYSWIWKGNDIMKDVPEDNPGLAKLPTSS